MSDRGTGGSRGFRCRAARNRGEKNKGKFATILHNAIRLAAALVRRVHVRFYAKNPAQVRGAKQF